MPALELDAQRPLGQGERQSVRAADCTSACFVWVAYYIVHAEHAVLVPELDLELGLDPVLDLAIAAVDLVAAAAVDGIAVRGDFQCAVVGGTCTMAEALNQGRCSDRKAWEQPH